MPENMDIKSDELIEAARGQAVVEARVAVGADSRVLSVSASAYVTPGEVFAGEARYTGKVRFDCLVVKDGRPGCVSAVADFTDKLTSPDITSGMRPIIAPEIVNTDAVMADGTLRLTAVVDTVAYAVRHCDFSCMTAAEDGIYVETRRLGYCTAVAEASETAYITDGMSDVKADEILCSACRAVVTGAECADGEVRVSGSTYTDIVALSGDTGVAYRMVTPFVKSLSAPGASAGDKAEAFAAVADCTATLAVDGDVKSIELAVTMQLDAVVFSMREADAVTDVFSCECELEKTASDVTLFCAEPLVTVTDAVDGQVALDRERPAADSVVCVTDTFCTVTGAAVADGRVTAEGLVGGDITYYCAEKNSLESIAFRLPFSMPLEIDASAGEVALSACVTDVSVKIRRESVLDIKAELAFTARLFSREKASVIESVRRGEAVQRPDATVVIHVVSPKETLWQAAKALGCSPEAVTAQNAAAAPYEGGERLISFCAKKK